MSKLQELLNEKYPDSEIGHIERRAFEEGYKAGATDQIFELYTLLQRAFIDGGEYAQDRSDVSFSQWFRKLTAPKNELTIKTPINHG